MEWIFAAKCFFGTLIALGVLHLLTKGIKDRHLRRMNDWRYGHPNFFRDLKRCDYPQDLQ